MVMINGWIDRWADGWMDGWIVELLEYANQILFDIC